MTTVRWNDGMLDQLSQTVQEISQTVQETSQTVQDLSQSVQQLTEATLKNEKQVNSLSRTVEAIATQMAADREERNIVLQVITRQQDQHDSHRAEIQELRIEMRGLRLETRRMLNYLLNEKDTDDEEET